MFSLISSLRAHRRLFSDFVKRDLKARYVGSSMGFFWSVIFPVVNLFVFMFVFRLLLKARWGDGGSETETGLIMLCGILVWASFAETISRATNCLVENANLIQKVVFPSEILPVYLTTSSLVNMLIGMPIVIIGCWVFQAGGPGSSVVLVPLLLVVQLLFTVGLGYLLATLNLFLRDTFHLVGVAVQVWMFATPIFYPGEMVANARIMMPDWLSFLSNMPLRIYTAQNIPDEMTELIGTQIPLKAGEGGDMGLAWMLDINPMHWLIDSWRDVIIFSTWPAPWVLIKLTLVSVGVFALGATFFRSQQEKFPDLL